MYHPRVKLWKVLVKSQVTGTLLYGLHIFCSLTVLVLRLGSPCESIERHCNMEPFQCKDQDEGTRSSGDTHSDRLQAPLAGVDLFLKTGYVISSVFCYKASPHCVFGFFCIGGLLLTCQLSSCKASITTQHKAHTICSQPIMDFLTPKQ